MTSDRRVWISAGLASAALVLHAWPTRWTTVDDAWITARYALLLAHGHGPVYNPGELVEGASSPLWTLLVGAAIRLGLDPGAVMVHAGLLCGLLLPLATTWLALRLGAGRIGAATAPWTVALSPHIALAATNGLETAAWLLALVLACSAALPGGSPRSGVAMGLGVGLLAALRPEGAVVAVALAVAHAVLARDVRRPFVAGVAGSVLTVLAVRFAIYGALLPNPVDAKHFGDLGHRLELNLRYVRIDGITWFVVAALAATAPLLPGRRLARAVPVAVGFLLLAGFFRVEEWMPAARLQLPLWVLATASWAAADLPRGLTALPVVGAALVLLSPVRASAVRYDTAHSVLPDNPAARAGQWIGAHAPAGSTIAMRDAGVVAFHVGPDVRVLEIHPRALTRKHVDGADVEPPAAVPELLVTTLQREDADGPRYGPDRRLLARTDWVFLGRVTQHHHRYYDFWARPDVPMEPLPEELRVR